MTEQIDLDNFDDNTADVADLILDLAISDRVDRAELRATWKREAADLRRTPAAIKFTNAGKGDWVSEVLRVAISRLEKRGLIRRAGQPPRQLLLIEDRAGLERLLDIWDAAQEQPDDQVPLTSSPKPPSPPQHQRVVSPLTRWRQGDRDDEARAAHLADLRARRNAAAARRLGPGTRTHVLREIATGRGLPEVAKAIGVSTHAIHGLARVDESWRHDLDAALLAGRPADVPHGTPTGYRRHGCRCPECRAAQHQQDKPRRTRQRVRPAPTPPRVCECCGGPITASGRRRFCSPSCSTRHSLHATCSCGGVQAPDTSR